MRNMGLAAAAIILLAPGCATKNYGRQGELTSYEQGTLSCREIDLETAKAHGFLSHVEKESQFDGRSVLSFLGDFGIGNLMERSSAVESATARLAQLQDLRIQRGCGNSVAGMGSVGGQARPQQEPARFGRYSNEAGQLPDVRACNPYPDPHQVAKGPGFESYTVACANGDAVSVRCEMSGCRVLR